MMTPMELHEYLLEKAGYDLPLQSIYRMLRQNRIKGVRQPVPRSQKDRWMISQEEADDLTKELKGFSPVLSPAVVLDRRSRTRKE